MAGQLCGCEPKLCQGDIFGLRIALPIAAADIQVAIPFDQQHSDNLADGGPEKMTAAMTPLANQVRRFPQEEFLVLGTAHIVDYFVVASQTCDLSGEGALPWSTIIPYEPLAYMLRAEPLAEKEGRTVLELLRRLGFEPPDSADLDMVLPTIVRSYIHERWQDRTRLPEDEKDLLKAVKTALSNEGFCKDSFNRYYIEQNEGLRVPEGYAYLSRIHTVPRNHLQLHDDKRLASLAGPHRESFAGKIGYMLSRVALDDTPKPPIKVEQWAHGE